jgi:hypothetical protein
MYWPVGQSLPNDGKEQEDVVGRYSNPVGSKTDMISLIILS